MTFLADESGIESSEPREAYEIILPALTYYLASGTRDLVISGRRYTASPIRRGEAPVSSSGESGARELSFTLPVSHALAQRFMQNGCPPKQVFVNVYRYQGTSATAEIQHRGVVTSMAPDGNLAHFRVPARSAEVMAKRLPTVTAGKSCPWILYDEQCTLARGSFTSTVTATYVDDRTVKATVTLTDQYALYGELEHVSSGERMTILDQPVSVAGVTTFTIQMPIAELQVGDSIKVYAGCDHQITTCQSKFSNRLNFGGFPQLPTKNPHLSNGFGVMES